MVPFANKVAVLAALAVFRALSSDVARADVPVTLRCEHRPVRVSTPDGTALVYEVWADYPAGRGSPCVLARARVRPLSDPRKDIAVYSARDLAARTLLIDGGLTATEDMRQVSRRFKAPEGGKVTLSPPVTAVVYFWVKVPEGDVPDAVVTTFYVSGEDLPDGESCELKTAVDLKEPVHLKDPLLGGAWLCSGAPGPDSYHRRSFLPVSGVAWSPQRFAADFILVGDTGRFAFGDLGDNANYYSYGKKVFASADGTVVGIRKDMPEHAPGVYPRDMGFDDLEGNHVTIDIGSGCFVHYGHLKGDSITLKIGDKVKRGDILAAIGNNGNADIPHLHLQVTDGADPYRSNGVPYVFEEFTLVGAATGSPDMKAGSWSWSQTPARACRLQMPAERMVIRFSNYY